MDEIPIVPVQNMDNEGGQVIADCLNTSVVIRKIFQHLSSTELLRLSLVNKLWSYEARTEIRNRGNVNALVWFTHTHDSYDAGYYYDHEDDDENDDCEPCKETIEEFFSLARKMTVVPFTGIRVGIEDGSRTCEDVLRLLPFDDVVLGQLKKVSVGVYGDLANFEGCPGLVLVEKVLQDSCRVIEELSLRIDDGREEFMEQIVQDCRFPRLKFLKLREHYNTPDNAYTNYMKELVSRAPRLEALQTKAPINSMLKALEGSSAVILYKGQVYAPFDEILETGISKLKLDKMLLFYTGRKFNFERFNRITPKLLQASCTTTLGSMSVNAVLAVPLMCYRVCLKSVTELNMHMNYHQLEQLGPWILTILKDFEFTYIFPSLKKVKICHDHTPEILPDHRSRIIALVNAVFRNPMPDRATNVKELCLNKLKLSDVATQYFSEMFPNIEKLDVVATDGEQIQFESIWENWVDLKELHVRGKLTQTTGNLDSIFCGLFPEEVAELRLKDEEYLKRVNIVAVMPAITCLRKLTTLRLNHEDYCYNAFADGASFMFSKVTALIAFARCPTLAVRLNTISYAVPPEMTHLEPYVTVTSRVDDDYGDWSMYY